ncbi:MAG: hypothetical protein E5V92_04065 [Mesorhizobium sp.]|nr:hypothetical protein EJ067_11655 [Mesorhizobium sp. M1D.F.Ca.ET.043.01.1.1]RWA89039.1 MAG: hypothetical protein EOQ32_21720 [Mesorhizobium sp.]RWD61698.1 MAG: hypothetical protein EOS36_17120 [Mesorhizobium sp.]RWE41875.1 MAG: hypothetical protein EOS79_17090 [Mesorhizobium sp.]TIV72539.1 MAG: hypothetical protein E5V89_04970 [Mesorhizobium sp.]
MARHVAELLRTASLAIDIEGPPGPKRQSVSPFHGNGETLYLFVFTQFRTENRYTLFLELL